MNLKLLILCLLLLTSQALYAANAPTHTRSRKYYAKQLRKAIAKRHVTPHKVRHAYNR